MHLNTSGLLQGFFYGSAEVPMVLGECPETLYKALSNAFFLLISPHHHIVNNTQHSLLLLEFSFTHALPWVTYLSWDLSSNSQPSRGS